MSLKQYDLVVIGGGPAGIWGAYTAAHCGKRVALVEKCATIGGAGINTGTIPSKTLRETAVALSGLRSRRLYGVDLSLRREATVGDFMHHERKVTAAERTRAMSILCKYRVDVVHGTAAFVEPHAVRVAGDGEPIVLRGEKILIATGSSPLRPAEFPFDHPHVHDSNELLDLDKMPRTFAVIGAGVIGSEYACTFAAIGARVHVIDGRDALLPFLDRDVADALVDAMQAAGIQFHWRERVVRCEPLQSGSVRLALASGAVLEVEGVLVAAGRSSNTRDLELARAGITTGERGLVDVDSNYRTCVPHIYAAGDVIGAPALASTSMEQARVAVCHAFGLAAQGIAAPVLPTGIYTIPEVSMAGESSASLDQKRVDYVVGRASYYENARGEIIGDDRGFLKLLFQQDDMRLLGVHVIGEQATELLHVGLIALETRATADLFVRTCFNFPTLGTLYKLAALHALSNRGE